MKYYFMVDGYVEYLREKQICVNAQTFEEAKEKADEKFRDYFYANGATQVGETLNIHPCDKSAEVNVKSSKISNDQAKSIISAICPDWKFIT